MSAGLFFPAEERLGFLGRMFDLELAKDGVPADVDLVPLGFNTAQGTFAHLAQVTERRGIADEGMYFLLGGRSDFERGVNHLELLHEDALELQKMILLRRRESFQTRRGYEMVELLP